MTAESAIADAIHRPDIEGWPADRPTALALAFRTLAALADAGFRVVRQDELDVVLERG